MRIFLAPMMFSLALAAGPAAAQGGTSINGPANPYAQNPYAPQAGGGGYTSQTNPYAPGGIYDPYKDAGGSTVGGSPARSASGITSHRKPLLGAGLAGSMGANSRLGSSRGGLNPPSGSAVMSQRQPGCGGTLNSGRSGGSGSLAPHNGRTSAQSTGCGGSTGSGSVGNSGNSGPGSTNPNLADTLQQSQMNRLQTLPQ